MSSGEVIDISVSLPAIFILVERNHTQGTYHAECLVGDIREDGKSVNEVVSRVLTRLQPILEPVLDGEEDDIELDGEVFSQWLEAFHTRFPKYKSQSLGFGDPASEEEFSLNVCLDPTCPMPDIEEVVGDGVSIS